MSEQNYILAMQKYDSCFAQDTSNIYPLKGLANCYFQLGDYAAAKHYFHKIEHDKDTKNEAISKLAIIYEAQQNLPKAIKYYNILVNTFPNNPIYYRKLGSLYIQGREQKQALVSYQKAIQLNPRDILSIQGLTEMYLSGDDILAADSLADTGIHIDSMNIGLQLLKSRIKYRIKDYKTASQILYRLSSLTELNNYYNKLLGYSLMQVDSMDKAIYFLQKSLLNENDPEYALFYLALAHEKKKEFEKSEWFFQEASKAGISENMSQYHRGLARIYTQAGDFKKVIDQYKKSLEYRPDKEVYFFLANAAEQYFKEKSIAISYYQKYLDSGHDNDVWVYISQERLKVLKESEFMKRKAKI